MAGEFVHYDLGQLRPGQTVEVTLDTQANVLLLDAANFGTYRGSGRYTYWGGWITQTPHRIPVPHLANWHVAIDLGGRSGTVRTSVRVLG